MATSGVDLTQQSQVIPPQQQASQEHTADAPMQGTSQEPQNTGGISEEDQQRLIALARRYKDQWSQDRRILIERILTNLEFFKGNQNIVFSPGSTEFINTSNWIDSVSSSQHAQNSDNNDLYQDCLNFYQMLNVGFVAALCPQVPKSKWMPGDAEEPSDVATAKAAQMLVDKVERDNKESSLLKSQLFFLYNAGSVFRFTRFVVSADIAGTKEEPVYDQTETELMPARMHCYSCGTDNQAGTPQCANCKSPMGADSFFPPVSGPVTRQIGTQEVPNGQVAQNLFCGLEVDVDPTAHSIRRTPILNLEYEVHIGALRDAYPGMFDQIQASATSELSTNGSVDRIARQLIYAQTDANSSILSDQRPTLSQTWFQKWAFALEDDKPFVERMKTAFPNGCLLINTGPTFLSCQAMDMNKHWTVAKTHEGYGMYPPAPGDVVVPFQRRYNDMANILHDGIARTFAGLIVSNNDLIDSKAFQGKQLQFGVFNPVKLKRTGAPGSFKLEDAFHQFEFAIKIAEGMEYQKHQALEAQTFALVPPQVYGGQGDPNIQTFGGQELNKNTALGALNIYWENLKDEHAEADELAVECAAENLTQDLQYSIEDKGAEFRNQYVRLDDLQGSIHAYSDTDQGLPVTPQELQQRWMTLLQAAKGNDVIAAIFDIPENQEQAADSMGVPGMVVPGNSMRNKTLQVIQLLLKAQPIPQVGPDGQPTGQMQPSIMPNAQVDDPTVAKQVIKQYCQNNFDIETDNPPGFENVLAYYAAMTDVETQQASQVQITAGKAALAGHLASQPPPPPPPQLSPAQQQVLQLARQDGAQGMADLVTIGGSGPLGQGESYQAQAVAAAKLVDVAMKAEQLNADITAPQGK